MKLVTLVLSLVGGVALAIEPQPPGRKAGTASEPSKEGVIDPRAEAALRRMSDYLSGLETFKVDATTVDEKVTEEGQKVQELQQATVTVRRPSALRVDRVSPRGHVVFRYDGRRFTAVNKDRNVYATAPAPPQLDEAIDQARERLRIDAPAGDLVVSAPYGALVEGLQTGRYVGLEPIDGVMAHHLAITKDHVDWQIWIKDGPDPVPLRYVITSKDLPAQPEFTLQLHNWRPSAAVPESTFSFTPPAGAQRVDFVPPEAQPQPQAPKP